METSIRRTDPASPRPRARHARGCRQIHHEASQGRARGAGVASGDASLDPGRDERRPDDAGADRHHASAAPPRDSRVRYGSEAPSLGKAQAGEGSMTEAASMNWSREFDEPIVLPDGGELRTLLDAGRYVDALPRSIHEREEWQAVMEVLLLAVEGREPVSLLRIALTLALQESGPTRGPRR